MSRSIVVAFRMPPAGIRPDSDGTYLGRARSLCSRGEALGGQLVAWSAALLAMAWDIDSIEEAVMLAVSVRQGSSALERAWAGGLAEGELEPFAPDGQRMHLAWGEALLAAASLARAARPGEVLVDGEVRALRASQLALHGARSSTDSGQRVRGWRLDIEHPWRSSPDGFPESEVSTEDVLQIVERRSEAPNGAAARDRDESPAPPRTGSKPPGLAQHVRALKEHDTSGFGVEALTDLRRTRALAEGGPAGSRCQAALALSMTLCLAGRADEALLEGLDALA
ncbi:MAG: hypothetical protein ACRENE_14785, partial [Polyangiaceae bacterium]